MRDFFNKNRIYIYASIIIIFIIILAFVIYDAVTFRVVSTSPANNGKINIGQSAVIFNFNQEIENIDFKSQVESPQKIAVSHKLNSKKLIVYVNNIEKGGNYTVIIKNIKSKSGKIIDRYQVNLKGDYLTLKQMSPESQKVALEQTDSDDTPGSNDPVTKILPKRTPNYSLKYLLYAEPIQKGKYVKIIATLFVPDYELSNTALLSQYKQEALRYLKTNGVNPNDYVIEWNPASATNL